MSEFRTPEEILLHHGAAVEAADLDAIVADYTDDAVFITPQGVLHGKDGVRRGFAQLLGDLPQAEWETALQVGTGVAFMRWSAVTPEVFASEGIDTFNFRDGLICGQTLCYRLERRH